MIVVSARAAALRILAERIPPPASATGSSFCLAEFQKQAVALANRIILQRGGVIIADSVGLGKTYVGAALVEQQIDAGAGAVVAVPAALRSIWRRALQPVSDRSDGRIRLVTHGQLSRDLRLEHAGFVLVDEAHAFRNPRTRRYRSLRYVCRSSRVVLLTATPVNNSLADLYFQLRLFCADDAFSDLGIGSLASLLRGTDVDAAALHRLRDAVVIRRTREQVRAGFRRTELPDGSELQFPQSVQLINVPYHPLPVRPIERMLESVSFALYRDAIAPVLVGLSLLKRVQSSRHAAAESVVRLLELHQRFLRALERGRLLSPSSLPSDSGQLCFEELTLEEVPALLSIPQLRKRVAADQAALLAFRRELDRAPDDKLPSLIGLLRSRPPPARTLVFTEFRDTARHLWRSLVHRFRVGLITGEEAFLGTGRSTRHEVIRRFAPGANQAASPSRSESVDVLVATDVLAEGLNLQDADGVVSYDLPWNPVKLIQRAGRIDRLGSPHHAVFVYNFLPDREFDSFVGLVRRLQEKLRALRSAIGQETPILEPQESVSAFYTAVPQEVAANAPVAAAPPGSIASTSCTASRVLVCWKGAGSRRELLVDGEVVTEHPAAFEAAIGRCLRSGFVGEVPAITQAIAASRAYLDRQGLGGSANPGASLLARAVLRAVQSQGVFATAEVLQAADAVLTALPGYLEHAPRHVAMIRKARTPAQLVSVLAEIRSCCSESSPKPPPDWQLIAAVAVD